MKKAHIIFYLMFVVTIFHATPTENERLIGTWVATVEHNLSFYTYEIDLAAGNRCTVRISNGRTEQAATGNWSWDGTFFRLNATFRNANIPHQNSIQWASVLTFVEGNDIFNILASPAVNAPQTRFTFVKQDSIEEDAIIQTFETLSQHIPQRARIAVININAADLEEGEYFLDELTFRLVNSRRYTVVDRRDIEIILAEQNFQLSGYVDYESAVSIGKFLGATVVITGSISGTGSRRRLVLRALDVQTAEILAMSSVSL